MITIDNIKSLLLSFGEISSPYCKAKSVDSTVYPLVSVSPGDSGFVYLYSPIGSLDSSQFMHDFEGEVSFYLLPNFLGVSGLYRIEYSVDGGEGDIFMEAYIEGIGGNDESFSLIQFEPSQSSSDSTFEQKVSNYLASSKIIKLPFNINTAASDFNRSFTDFDLKCLKEKAALFFGCNYEQIGIDFKCFEILQTDLSNSFKSIGLQSNQLICLLDVEFSKGSNEFGGLVRLSSTQFSTNNVFSFVLNDSEVVCNYLDKFNLFTDIKFNKMRHNWGASLHCIVLTFRQ